MVLIQKRAITAGSNLQGLAIIIQSAYIKEFHKISVSNMQKFVKQQY